ncbi:MAG: type IV pilin [Nitrososphaerota archaeon]|nr:type IV pilin [Nitrososphaerota archaeon]
MKISGQRRKAISPIIATVLIIAATLIAFAAVLGYIFGIFGGAANKADVTISTETSFSLAATSNVPTGTIYFVNSGTSTTTATSATLSYGGTSCALTVTTTISPGSTANSGTVTCPSSSTAASAGESYTLSVVLADGSSTTYTGTFA